MNDWPVLGNQEDRTQKIKTMPEAKSIVILDRAMELIQEVDYDVTSRWVFYGLWQGGYYADVLPTYNLDGTKKNSAKSLASGRWSKLASRVRHSEVVADKWPMELIDDRRDPVHRTEGFNDPGEWLSSLTKNVRCNVDCMANQDCYVMIAFEAEAMLSQFKHYTESYGVSLWPLSGQTSIPYKKRIAKHIEWAFNKFGKPVIFLYFGDYDKSGKQIPETAFSHIRKWCQVEFSAYRAGLNEPDIARLKLPDDPKKEGKYQWEALRDKDAREMITGALDGLLRLDALNETLKAEQDMTAQIKAVLNQI